MWHSAFTPRPPKIIFGKKNRTGGAPSQTQKACWFHGVFESVRYRIRIIIPCTFVLSECFAASLAVERKSIVTVRLRRWWPVNSVSYVRLNAGLNKKVTLELAIYYFDFKWGDGDKIDRVSLGPFNYIAFRLCWLFGRCYRTLYSIHTWRHGRVLISFYSINGHLVA